MKTRNLSINLPLPSVDYREVIKLSTDKIKGSWLYINTNFSRILRVVNVFFARFSQFAKNISLRRKKIDYQSPDNPKGRSRFNFKKLFGFFVALVFVVAIAYIVTAFLNGRKLSATRDDTKVQDAKKTLDVYRDFDFPLRDGDGEGISNIKYTIEKVELRDEIVVKGQKATAIDGKTFLVVYLKIKNEYDKTIKMNTRDYLRLSLNGNLDEWLAPDIHNDPVEIQAISTKYTRLGFPLNDSDTSVLLRVGEIEGEKQEIPLSL